jgi:hypothetical protein
MYVLTSIDDFSEEIFAAEEVLGGTVPSAVVELVLALVDGHVGTFGDGDQDARVFAHQAQLLPPQR